MRHDLPAFWEYLMAVFGMAMISAPAPSLYPFDQYRLWLGVGGLATLADGTSVELRPESLAGRVVTFQNRIPDIIMDAPTSIAPETVSVAADPFGFLAVQALTFERPAYLKVLAVVLVVLIAISASLALFTRGIDELALGFGGIILGVWGVRSILMPQSLSTVTAIDLALSWLILLLLLGLAVRAMLHFHRHSDLPLPRPGVHPDWLTMGVWCSASPPGGNRRWG